MQKQCQRPLKTPVSGQIKDNVDKSLICYHNFTPFLTTLVGTLIW